MARNELFPDLWKFRAALTEPERIALAKQVIRDAKLGLRYFYPLRMAAGLLHLSTDEIQSAVHFYRIDCTALLSTFRIPWWSLAEYLLDPADDLEIAFYEYINSLPRRGSVLETEETK
jgi:hypothetical protein